MANGIIGTATQTPGMADSFGGKLFDVPSYSGPKFYNSGIGDHLTHREFGFGSKIMAIFPTLSASGSYFVWGQPAGAGWTTWYLRWFIVGTGQEVGYGVDLSGEVVQLAGIGV